MLRLPHTTAMQGFVQEQGCVAVCDLALKFGKSVNEARDAVNDAASLYCVTGYNAGGGAYCVRVLTAQQAQQLQDDDAFVVVSQQVYAAGGPEESSVDARVESILSCRADILRDTMNNNNQGLVTVDGGNFTARGVQLSESGFRIAPLPVRAVKSEPAATPAKTTTSKKASVFNWDDAPAVPRTQAKKNKSKAQKNKLMSMMAASASSPSETKTASSGQPSATKKQSAGFASFFVKAEPSHDPTHESSSEEEEQPDEPMPASDDEPMDTAADTPHTTTTTTTTTTVVSAPALETATATATAPATVQDQSPEPPVAAPASVAAMTVDGSAEPVTAPPPADPLMAVMASVPTRAVPVLKKKKKVKQVQTLLVPMDGASDDEKQAEQSSDSEETDLDSSDGDSDYTRQHKRALRKSRARSAARRKKGKKSSQTAWYADSDSEAEGKQAMDLDAQTITEFYSHAASDSAATAGKIKTVEREYFNEQGEFCCESTRMLCYPDGKQIPVDEFNVPISEKDRAYVQKLAEAQSKLVPSAPKKQKKQKKKSKPSKPAAKKTKKRGRDGSLLAFFSK